MAIDLETYSNDLDEKLVEMIATNGTESIEGDKDHLFFGIKAKPGVSRANIMCLFLLTFFSMTTY
jgi:hypothetical protein